MGLFDFFRKRKERSIEKAFAEIEKELGSDAKPGRGPGHAALDRCEQMIKTAQELEEEKAEYRIVTSYLKDVEVLQNLPEEEKRKLKETADNVSVLLGRREKYLNRKKKISDADYAMMEREEDTLPDTIRRYRGNEVYLETIERDMRYLEGEKTQWEMLGDDYRGSVKRNRVLLILLFITVIMGTVVILVLPWSVRTTFLRVWIPLCAVLALAAAGIYLKGLNDRREIQQAQVNKKRAVELLNRARIKYVHTKNALDYISEKYHVRNAMELEKRYESFQEASRERAKFSENNEDLHYFSDKLLKLLRPYKLYDDRIWLSQANALSDPKEMVEVKHNLIARRQKLREGMSLHLEELLSEKRYVEEYLATEPEGAEEIRKILRKIEYMTDL
ncbi:MAG: hypothetical protein IJT05_05960 [Lachnospiraceae bacterium]|nr:hypothetical protein [Lachnospiraceae bacterium]